MKDGQIIRTIILVIVIIASLYGIWVNVIDPFFIHRKRIKKDSISNAARHQTTLIDRRAKK